MDLFTIIASGAGAAATIVAAPAVLAGLGFTAGGIAVGSVASSMMSITAVANGGGVTAGSVVAILQSAGAAGLPMAGQAVAGAVGAAMATAASMASNCTL